MTSSTLALIPETPRGQERSLLELPNEQIEDIKIEKVTEYSSYFIPVQIPFWMINCLRRLKMVYPDL
jgi:hypothetical protein